MMRERWLDGLSRLLLRINDVITLLVMLNAYHFKWYLSEGEMYISITQIHITQIHIVLKIVQ